MMPAVHYQTEDTTCRGYNNQPRWRDRSHLPMAAKSDSYKELTQRSPTTTAITTMAVFPSSNKLAVSNPPQDKSTDCIAADSGFASVAFNSWRPYRFQPAFGNVQVTTLIGSGVPTTFLDNTLIPVLDKFLTNYFTKLWSLHIRPALVLTHYTARPAPSYYGPRFPTTGYARLRCQ